jgi:hypothetical protein
MSQILVDCDILRRLLEKYFHLEAENRAYFFAAYRAGVQKPGLRTSFADAIAEETARQKEHSAGHRSILQRNLDARDADAFHQTLSALLPRQSDPAGQ